MLRAGQPTVLATDVIDRAYHDAKVALVVAIVLLVAGLAGLLFTRGKR